jgi:hypothetical protein
MNENPPTIADIQTTELIYYDADYLAECYSFCEERDIDCLPAVDDPDAYYQRNDDSQSFDKRTITPDRRLDANMYVFKPDLLECFHEHPLQFVFEHGTLTGVVHFSDYNRDMVSTYLYAQLVSYERELRELLISHYLTNDDMADHLRSVANNGKKPQNTRDIYERNLRRFEQERETPEFKRYPEFQTFYLKELQELARKQQVIALDAKVGQLRNQIMHAKDSVNMVDARTPDYIYELETFENFFTLVQTLLKDGRRIHSRLLSREGMSLGRRA